MTESIHGVAAEQLRSFITRIELLEEDKANILSDIREVYAEAKGQGFDVKIMRQIVRERKMNEHDWREQQKILLLYRRALGMQMSLPLVVAAE